MPTPSQLLQFLIGGLTVGSIYALIALGFVTIYNVTGIVNLSQGEFAVLGALVAVTLSEPTRLFNRSFTLELGLPLPLAMLIAIAIVTFIGGAFYQLALRPARHAAIVSLIIITIGASIMLRGLALIAWGTDPYTLPRFTTGPPLDIAGAVMTRQAVWVVATTVVVVGGLYFFFEKTMLGKALRACALNTTAARLMGISTERMALFAFALSAGVGALAGIVITPLTPMGYDSGTFLGLKGFVAAIMGGLTSAPGAVIGGLLLGVLETLGAGLISSGYKDAIAFIVLFGILFARVSGVGGWLRIRARGGS
jgi:branched-chain amino acid transport system permease protein